MHPSTLFTILVSVVGTAQATCYRSGETWAPDQVQANNALSDVCNNLTNNFNGGQTKYACRNAGSANKKLEFWIGNTAGNALYLNHGDCVLRLSNEINGCSRGGDTTIAGWNFRGPTRTRAAAKEAGTFYTAKSKAIQAQVWLEDGVCVKY